MRHVEHVWDTVVSIDVAGASSADPRIAIDAVITWVHRVDDVLSGFRPDSDLCRWQRGELDLSTADPMLAEVLELARWAQELTHGGFDLGWSAAGPDPTGLVKGWAVDRAVALARAQGMTDLQINAGGDVCTVGSRPRGGPWRIGIEDPHDRGSLVDIVVGNDLCVATSGTSQRGQHVRLVTPATRPVTSVTVVGPTLAGADALSTAAMALGVGAPELLCRLTPTCTSLVVQDDGKVWTSPGWFSAVGTARS